MEAVDEFGSVAVVAMGRNGYEARSAEGSNPYLVKLKSWIWEHEFKIDPLHKCDEDHWEYEISLESNNVDGLTYTGYITMCESEPDIAFCIKTHEFRNGIREGGALEELVASVNKETGEFVLFVDEELICCIRKELLSTEQLTSEFIEKLIYDCYGRIESLVSSHEYETWCLHGKAVRVGDTLEQFIN